MTSPADTAEQIRSIAGDRYKYGFVTEIESERAPQRSRRGDRPLHLGEEGGAGLAARLAAEGLSAAGSAMEEPTWAKVQFPPIDYQDAYYYSAPKQNAKLKSLDEVDPGTARAPTRSSAFRCASRRSWPASPTSRSMPCSTASRSPRPSRRSWRRRAVIFCSDLRSGARSIRSWCGSISARSCPTRTTIYATLNSAVFTDGSFVYVPKGVRCPMELSTYFRINAAKTGQFERTLIIADEGRVCQLSRRLHRADARREPAARGGGRAGGAGRCRDQVLDRAELVSGRRGGQGRHLQLRHQARRLPRPQLEDLVDPGGDRIGDHLEVSELHPAGRRLGRRVLLDRRHQQSPAGRYRHQDDPSRPQHALARSSPRASPPATAQNTYRGLVKRAAQAPRARATTRSATRC